MVLRDLARRNAAGDVAGLAAMLRDLLPSPAVADGLDVAEAMAAMRDLGFLLGSIRRHDTEPVTLVPQVVPVLRLLGERTRMVPRDTVLHYGTWNPPDERCRAYTDDPQEGYLQESVRMVFADLYAALEISRDLLDRPPTEDGFADRLHAFADHLGILVDSMDLVIRKVTRSSSPTGSARTWSRWSSTAKPGSARRRRNSRSGCSTSCCGRPSVRTRSTARSGGPWCPTARPGGGRPTRCGPSGAAWAAG
ncbi:DUF1864 family protein [Micromonospora sp. Llam7]|nr:DUF1864 family protein [Micromonospora tarapacensis]